MTTKRIAGGSAGGGTSCVDPDCRDPSAARQGMKFNPVYENVQHWSTPRIIDTWEDMPWQPMAKCPSLNVKYPLDDRSHGSRATMWYLEAGAATPEFMTEGPNTYAH